MTPADLLLPNGPSRSQMIKPCTMLEQNRDFIRGPLFFNQTSSEDIGNDLADHTTHLNLNRQSSAISLKDSITKFMTSNKTKLPGQTQVVAAAMQPVPQNSAADSVNNGTPIMLRENCEPMTDLAIPCKIGPDL